MFNGNIDSVFKLFAAYLLTSVSGLGDDPASFQYFGFQMCNIKML
jgi:hypothetical protein